MQNLETAFVVVDMYGIFGISIMYVRNCHSMLFGPCLTMKGNLHYTHSQRKQYCNIQLYYMQYKALLTQKAPLFFLVLKSSWGACCVPGALYLKPVRAINTGCDNDNNNDDLCSHQFKDLWIDVNADHLYRHLAQCEWPFRLRKNYKSSFLITGAISGKFTF